MNAWWLLVLILPTAGAQWSYDFSLELEDPSTAIAGQQLETEAEWTLSCQPGAAAVDPLAPVRVRWTWLAEDAPWALIPPAPLQIQPICPGEVRGAEPAIWRPSHLVEGLEPYAYELEANWEWLTPMGDQNATTTVTMTGSVAAQIQIRAVLAQSIEQAEPGEEVTFTISVTNHGNVPTFMRIHAPGLNVPEVWPPEPLAPRTQRHLNLTTVLGGGPGWNNDETPFLVTLTPYAAADPSLEGTPVEVNTLARTRGTPAAGLPVVLVGLALAAMRR